MNTVNRSKCSDPSSQNWIGSTTKKASTRLRWSPWRVGESVMNSRSARNETTANSTVATVSPEVHPTQNTSTMNHEVRSRPAKFLRSRRLAWSLSSSPNSRKDSAKATPLASTSKPNTIRNSAPTCWPGVRLRRNWFTGRAAPARRTVCAPESGAAPRPRAVASARQRSPNTGSAPGPPHPWGSRAARC